MTTTNNCVLCFLTVAVAVTSGFNEATSTEEPSIRVARSQQSSITDAILGANLQFLSQAARSGQSVLESKLSAARAMVEAGTDMISAKIQAAKDMAGVALNGGKVIAGTTLGTISETADDLVIALGYPAEVNSRRRRDSDKKGKQRDDDYKDDDKRDDDDGGEDESDGKELDDDGDVKSEKQDDDDDKSKRDKKDDDDDDDKSKKKGKKDDRRKRDAVKENVGARHKRSLSSNIGRSDEDGLQTTGLIDSPCMGCMPEVMIRTVALKGGAFGGVVGMMGGKGGASGVGGGSAGAAVGAGVGAGFVGEISGGLGGKAGMGPSLVGGLGGKAGAGAVQAGGLGGKAGSRAGVVGAEIGGAIGGTVEVLGRRKREARRFGGGRSRFSPARGGAPKKGQSDTSSGSDSTGSSSARLRKKRAIIDHVLQHLRRDKRQDAPTAMDNGGKTNCFSFHSFKESEEEKKFWENFHNMMNEHDKDWDFDFESEMCGTGGVSTGALSTNAVEGSKEATTPLPPTIEA